MDEEEYACESFVPQKFRRDVCKSCFQPFRLHGKKQRRQSGSGRQSPSHDSAAAAETKSQTGAGKSGSQPSGASSGSGCPSPKAEPKVFQRFRVNREVGIDRDVPARERTPPKQLEGVTPGKIKRFLGPAPSLKVKPMPVVAKNRGPVSGRVQAGGAAAHVTSQQVANPQVASSQQHVVASTSPQGGASQQPLRTSASQPRVASASQVSSAEKQQDSVGAPSQPLEAAGQKLEVAAPRQEEATSQQQGSIALADAIARPDGGETADVSVKDAGTDQTGSGPQEPLTETQAEEKTAGDSEAERAQETVPSVERESGSGTEVQEGPPQLPEPELQEPQETETEEHKIENEVPEVRESQPVGVASPVVVDSEAEQVQDTVPDVEPESGSRTEDQEAKTEEPRIENEVQEEESPPVAVVSAVSSDVQQPPPQPSDDPSPALAQPAEPSLGGEVTSSEPEPSSVPEGDGDPQLPESESPLTEAEAEAGAEGVVNKEVFDEANIQEPIPPQAVGDESKTSEQSQAAESENSAPRDTTEEAGNAPGPEPAASQEVGPEPAAPQEVVGPEPAAPQEVGPEPAAPQEVGPEPAAPQEVGPEPAAPQEVGPEPAASQEVGPEPAAPQEVGPEPATPQEVGPEPAAPQEVGPEPASPQEVDPEPAAPQEVGPEPAAPQEVGPEPAAPQEVGPEPAAPQEVGPEPATPQEVEEASKPTDPASTGSGDVTRQDAVEVSGSSAPEPTEQEPVVASSQPAAVEATPSSLEQVEATPSSLEQVEATPSSLEQVEATPSSLEQVATSANAEGEVTSTPTEEQPSPSENAPGDVPPPPPLPPGVPAPPPPPPLLPVASAPATPPTRRRQRSLQENKTPDSVSAHSQAMSEILGGVSLRSVPPPPERAVGEERIVDVASELRQRALKQRKQEAETVSTRIEGQREDIKKMADLLHGTQGSPTFLNRLKQLLRRVETFLKTTDIPAEILSQKAEWPAWLVDDLREVLQYMRNLEAKIAAAENLCKQTLEGSASSPQLWKVNPLLVERCVQDVVRIARELNSDESRYFSAAQSFPVDEADLHALLQRAADAIAPLLDKLYEKALQSHQSVFDPTATKYDLSFRLQNAMRLLSLCCNISDQLGINLQVPKHPCYSEAQLKSQELKSDFYKTLQVTEREGKWDTEEQVELQRPFVKRGSMTEVTEDTQLLSQVLEAVGSGRGLEEELARVTPQLFAWAEVQLIKAAVGNGELQVIDSVMALRDKCCQDADSKHKHDFDWLLEAITKATHTLNDNCECVKYLVQKHSISINCQSSSHGNSILHSASQRQALGTMATLVRLGANPLLKNAASRGPLQLLGLKCFPPHRFSNKMEEKEPLFDLSSYINSPSLSDVVLISAEQQRFHAHRLVMCAQSPVFKTLLDSDLWVESKNKEVPLPTISGQVLKILLQYLYTGRCLFPRDDLNIGVELMAAADQFLLEPMRLQCERVLSEKMDAEVVVPLYYAAFRYSAPRLLANCCHFLLVNYKDVSDPGHEALLHLLENQQKQPQK